LIIFSYRKIDNYIKNVFYRNTNLSDHSFVCMTIHFTNVERGPGVWILNNTFLQDREYHEKISKLIDNEKLETFYDREILVWWDNLKYKIKKMSQIYVQKRRKNLNKVYNNIQRQFSKCTEHIAHGKIFDIDKYEEIKQQLAEIEYEKCQGAILRSKALWAVEGDKNTK